MWVALHLVIVLVDRPGRLEDQGCLQTCFGDKNFDHLLKVEKPQTCNFIIT